MGQSKNKTIRKIKYNFLYFLSFLVSFIGYIGLKLLIVVIAIGVAFLTKNHIGDLGLTMGYIIGLFTAGLLFTGLQRLYPFLEKLEDYTKTYKQRPYTEKYGKDYPQPTPENFGINQEEFKDYNNRFQFGYIKLIFTYGIWITACVIVIRQDIKGSDAIFLVGGVGMTAILLNHLFDYWNKRISQKHQHYHKINEFQKSVKIYFKIREENSTF